MEDGKYKNSFLGGLDRDTTPENYPNNKIYDATNFRFALDEQSNYFGRIINEKGNSLLVGVPDVAITTIIPQSISFTGVVVFNFTLDDATIVNIVIPGTEADYDFETVEGIQYMIDLCFQVNNSFAENSRYQYTGDQFVCWSLDPDRQIESVTMSISANLTGILSTTSTVTDHVFIGAEGLRNSVVAFTTNIANDSQEPTSTDGAIWEIELDTKNKEAFDMNLRFYNEATNFSISNQIKAVTSFENDSNRKVYWIDSYNNLRFYNLASASIFTAVTNLELAPDASFGSIELFNKGFSGNFLSGAVQYAYQLYNKYGNQTAISPLSDLYSVRNGDGLGGKVNEITRSSFSIDISGIDSNFTSIRVYRLHYTQEGVTPSVTLITDEQFGSGTGGVDSSFRFTDTGDIELGTVSLDELLLLGSENIKPEDIAAKDNILFAAGIETEEFDVDFDARAYCFKQGSNELRLIDKQDGELVIDATNLSALENVPEEHDALNPEFWDANNSIERKGHFTIYEPAFPGNSDVANYRFFQKNSTVHGGTGLNISYEITTASLEGDDMILDEVSNINDDTESQRIEYITGGPAGGEKNFNNPYYMDWRGYQRGEIYRFAIMLIRSDGKRSFAKWIADIKIPEHHMDLDFTDSTKTATAKEVKMVEYRADLKTYANPMYVKFIVNIPQSIINEGVVGYQILRVEREDSDKTIVDQGMVEQTYNSTEFVGSTTPYMQMTESVFDNIFTFNTTLNPYNSRNIWAVTGATDNFGHPWMSKTDSSGNSNYDQLKWAVDGDPRLTNSRLFLNKVRFCSPQVSYYKEQRYESGLYLEIIGSNRNLVSSYTDSYNNLNMFKYKGWRVAYKTDANGDSNRWTQKTEINNLELAQSPDEQSDANFKAVNIGDGKTYRNYTNQLQYATDSSGQYAKLKGGFGGTCLVMSLNFDLNPGLRHVWEKDGNDYNESCRDGFENYPDGLYDSGPLITNIKRQLSAQYGGCDFSSRRSNTYMEVTEVIPVVGQGPFPLPVARRGDTYISFFRHLRKMRGEGSTYYEESGGSLVHRGYGNAEFIAIPMECTVNVQCKSNKDPWSGESASNLRETEDQTNSVALLINSNPGDPAVGFNTDDQYQLNKAYNQENTTSPNPAEPLNFDSIEIRDVETRFSDVKQYNELIDGWTIFRTNNVNNVDSRFGKLKGLQFFNNTLIFLQENGFGVWQVNQQALITAQDGAKVELGSGGVLARYDYISKENGTLSKFSVASGARTMLFYDQNRDKIIRYSPGSAEELSVTKGMNSYLEQLFLKKEAFIHDQNPITNEGVFFYYDSNEKEFLMTFKTSTTELPQQPINSGSVSNKITVDDNGYVYNTYVAPDSLLFEDTLTFSEKLDAFAPRQGYTPGFYVACEGTTSSVSPDLSQLFIHKKKLNNRGIYYDQQPESSTITFILNPAPGADGVYIFDNIMYLLDVSQWNETNQLYNLIHDEGLDAMEVWNDTQRSNVIDLKTAGQDRIRKKFSKWRAIIPRSGDTLERMRDTHMFLKLTFLNTYVNNFSVISRRIALSKLSSNIRPSRL